MKPPRTVETNYRRGIVREGASGRRTAAMIVAVVIAYRGNRMRDSTRRNFLAVAGLGTAGGVAALATAGSAGAAVEDSSLPGDAPGSMAAYVHDIKSGKITLLVEGHQVEVTDKALVAKLARTFSSANRTNGGR